MFTFIVDAIHRHQRNPALFALYRTLFDVRHTLGHARYAVRARLRGVRYDEDAVRAAIRKRMQAFNVRPKPRGRLNLFWFCRIRWFDALAAEAFGRVHFCGLAERGYDVHAPGWLPDGRLAFQDELLREIRRAHDEQPLDLFIGYLSHSSISRETIDAVHAMGIPVVGINWDDTSSYWGLRKMGVYRGNGPIVNAFEAVWTANRLACPRYLLDGGRPVFLPEGGHPDFFSRQPMHRDIDVLFVGTRLGYREQFVRHLKNHGVAVRVQGPGWGTPPVSDEEMVRLYNRSRIVLGFSGVGPSRRFKSLKGRDFEVPMCGALYLREYSREIDECFSVGTEIECFTSKADCLAKVRALLADESRAESIRQAGYARARRDHTWSNRFTRLFRDILGIME